jgi:hypothetical protein
MLYLDTDYLIQGLVKGSKEAAELSQWYRAGPQCKHYPVTIHNLYYVQKHTILATCR